MLSCESLCNGQLDEEAALEQVGAYFPDRRSGGSVSRRIIQAEFETDYIIAYRVRNGLTSMVFSSDSDMVALCGPNRLSIRSFKEEKGQRKRKFWSRGHLDMWLGISFNSSCNKAIKFVAQSVQ